MANEPADRSSSLLSSVTRMVEAAINEGTGYDTLIHVLSLLCLVSILSHSQTRGVQAAPAGGGGNPLHKLLGDLTKGDGGGLGPDALVSLLPLLNSPQLKNKLNPATIGAVMSLLGNMGDKSDTPKSEKNGDKSDVPKADKGEEKAEAKRVIPPTAATVTSLDVLTERPVEPEPADGDKKGLGRYLNWKNNF